MADGEQDIDDQALFDNTLSNTPEPVLDTPVIEPVVQPQHRDDKTGQFAPKAAPVVDPVKPDTSVTPKVDAPHQPESIPPWRLKEEADARRDAERRASDFERRLAAFEQQKPKPEPVDFFANPDEALQQRLSPFEQRLNDVQSALVLRASRAEAVSEHGKDAVKELEQAVAQGMQEGRADLRELAVRMRGSEDPVGIAMQWHQREKMLKETGGDLTAYRQKLRDEALNDPEFLSQAAEKLKGAAAKNPIARAIMPLPSITKVGATALPEGQDEVSDAELFNSTTTRRKRA